MSQNETVRRRRLIQWLIAPVVVVVIGLGWWYPALGFVVPVVMITGVVGSFFRGRYVCGHLCPPGAVWGRWFNWAGAKRPIPDWMRSMTLRWALFAALMGFVTFNVSRDPSNWRHWGHAFWLMWTVTASIGLVLAALVHPRGWCTVCPGGTIQNAIGGGRHDLLIDKDKCRQCFKCEEACPLRLPIVTYREEGLVRERDCLKCSECVAACSSDALRRDRECAQTTPT